MAVMQPRKKDPKDYLLKRVLVDAGATLNLIPKRLAAKTNTFKFPDTSLFIYLANGDQTRLLGYTECICTVAEVSTIVEAYPGPGDTSYSMILGRPWLRFMLS